MKKTFMAGLMVATALTCAAPADAQNIFEALSETYNTNPTLQAQRAYLRSIDENVAIAKSGYRPNIALTGSYNDANRNSDIIANDGASQADGFGGYDFSAAFQRFFDCEFRKVCRQLCPFRTE
ncbi:MAG: TolC family protein [Alphaproteobacteria bacterium]